MEEIKTDYRYSEFKNMLDTQFKEVACGFIKIGYLLKIARDTNVLYESGYHSVTEFAQAEYGLSKDIVSRYIAINNRYSAGGYSDEIDEKYKGYGVAKLAEMLTLPDSIIDEISPSLTRREIQDLKNEIREEEKITDIEVMLEEHPQTAPVFECLTDEFVYYYLKGKPEIFEKLKAAVWDSYDAILEILCPAGIGLITARIPGKGKYALSIKGTEEDLVIINLRSNEKDRVTWQQLSDSIILIANSHEYPEIYETEEVAPVQPEHRPVEKTEDQTENGESCIEQPEAGAFYPEPVQMTSICYSCLHNTECERKTTITTECNEYVNKAEAEKTEEQKYQEKQDRIDHETKKKLEQRADEAAMNHLPGEEPLKNIHQVRLGSEFFKDVAEERKRFELRKNDRNYKTGDWLELLEFKEGKHTGRMIRAEIIYMLEDFTGLEEGYCILGIQIEKGKNIT